ncbi:MAG TPA: dienelactone hydrolase family protein, partial [Pyrinomonadaceae bacterium]|nr:dienelactone hydrolase family protein [Pyrinomonadaceae bacterium]
MAQAGQAQAVHAKDIQIRSGDVMLNGDLTIPEASHGIALFAYGSGSSRFSPRNQFVARTIQQAGIGTLLFDLLTQEEEIIDARTRHLRFDIGLLSQRLIDATYWIKGQFDELSIGYFGSSTGGGAALVAAAELGESVGAVVSRGGRPDLASDALPHVKSPTLLIVGGFDYPVIEINKKAFARLGCEKELKIVPGATHLFEEPGALEQVADLATDWFSKHLGARI